MPRYLASELKRGEKKNEQNFSHPSPSVFSQGMSEWCYKIKKGKEWDKSRQAFVPSALLQRGHFLYFQIFWNSYFYFFSVCFHFQTWDVFMKLKNNTKNFRLKIFINKKSSDLAQNLRAVRAPEGLTAHKISAKSDDILLTQIFKWNFGISWTVTCLFFSCFENWETKSQSVC